MRKKFVVGNWKMHTTAAAAKRLSEAIVAGLGNEGRVCIAVCPPFPYLALVGEVLKGSRVALGAQNLYPENDGAFTGEISPTMLLDLGCKYVIVGHSERRQIFGESNTFINRKIRFALSAGLDVIFCVGETLDERQADQTDRVLTAQVTEGLAGVAAGTLAHLSIAYEPLWAIGKGGQHATPQQAQGAHAVIRHRFGQTFDEQSAHRLTIQYGGSVTPEDARVLLSQSGVDGALVGGASLHADEFLAIARTGFTGPQLNGGSA